MLSSFKKEKNYACHDPIDVSMQNGGQFLAMNKSCLPQQVHLHSSNYDPPGNLN